MGTLTASRADRLEELGQIIDIIVEVEGPVGERHQLRVAPVSDVNVVARQHPLDRSAQQRREVTRHRRDDQQLRMVLGSALAHEMLQRAERLSEDDFLADADRLAADLGRFQAELGLSPDRRRMCEDVEAGGDNRAHRAIRHWIGRIVEPAGAHSREAACPSQEGALHFISVVKHRTSG
jgi:hypothetical protein